MKETRPRVGLLVTHPIQYYSPWYRALSAVVDLEVFYSHKQTARGQAEAGFGVAFEWDVPVTDGFTHTFLRNVSRHPDVNRFSGCDTPEIATIIRDRHYDAFIVHGWATRSYWQAMRACWRTHTPLLVRGDSHLATPRTSWWRSLKTPIYRWFIPKFDAYLTVGTRAREYLLAYGADPSRCFRAPHAVDNAFFASQAAAHRGDRVSLRREFGAADDSVLFLFVGKFIEGKEPHAFVTAVRQASLVDPRVRGLMVGDGTLRADVEKRAKDGGAPVHFTGFLNQRALVTAYVAADVLVVPSAHETWGLTVNEAMACGIPAIVTDAVGCAGDLVVHGKTGEIFRAGDVSELTYQLVRLTQDPVHRAAITAGARRHIRAFDISAAVDGTLQAIRAVRSQESVSGTRMTSGVTGVTS